MFLATSLPTTLFNFFKSTGAIFNLAISKSYTLIFILFKLVGTVTSLLISNLSTLPFKAIKSFLADVSTPVA